ncbi:GNAT family N-acetyltransferase [Gracilibacillus sp. S3-1-1]|uniref:GNAT family N-acetyltransferase n=1 Tax=Gracilibacillus pellucidus TaxID=3095368 RepID=A0ACC6M5A8_9BACI|nr:GNAT family N-acetyltransferase [Gracilibacillus sp. S3-1-1]MDX8046150.1 GNAT family N-acetyltransferase [Gracilibacillus sp. S3-1-1]
MSYSKTAKTIETNRLLLRLFNETDAPEVAMLCNNYNLYKNTLYLPYPYSIEDALVWIKHHLDNFNDDKYFEFAITDKTTGKLYGAIALSNHQQFNNGEIAYWIGEEYWGHGYATEAAKAILEFGFVEKGYNKVFARYFHSNPASGRVIEKIGMKKEGTLREHVKKDGGYLDLIYFGILKHETNFFK